MGLEDLPDIHPRRHAEGVEHDVDARPVLEIGHVLDRHDVGDHALVAVAASHLVAGLHLALHRDEDLDHLEHAGRQLVAPLQLVDLALEAALDPGDILVELRLERLDPGHDRLAGRDDLPPLPSGEGLENPARDLAVGRHALGAAGGDPVQQQRADAVVHVALDDRPLIVAVLGEALDLLALDRERALVLVDAAPVEDADLHHRAHAARRHTERRVAHIRRLFAEDRPQQFFLWRHGRFALGRDLADQNVSGLHFGTDVDDAGLVQVPKPLLADVGDIAGNLLLPELRVARHHLEFLDMDRGEDVVLDQPLGDQDRILEVVAIPRHEGDEHVAPQGKLAVVSARPVSDDVARHDPFAHPHERPLRDARALIGTLELQQVVDIDAGRFRACALFALCPHHDAGGVDLLDGPGAARGDGGARIPCHHLLHAGADQRRLRAHQGHRLALHVGAHQRPVRVVVLQERDEGGSNRDELLGRDVHIVDALRRRHHELAVAPAAHQVLAEGGVLVRLRVGLGDGVLPLLDRGEIDDLVGLAAVLHPAVGAFDETVTIDPRVGGETVDQADIRAFRRFDRADAPVVRRMHVAHLEARPLAREPARPERGQPALVRDFRQRVGLVHELGKLGRAEELAYRRRRRLGVDQIVRHDGIDIDRAHPLANGALHPEQADPVLVLHQLADRTHPAVAQMIDVVDIAAPVLQRNEGGDDGDDVLAP